MLIFGLRSTSDDQPSDPSDESQPKCGKMATKLSKSEMLILRLHSTSDDWPSNPSDESCRNVKKWLLNCQKMKCLFFDYVQLLR